ncbi:MAG: hypothetical protein HOE53_01875 [Candidatus Magasanikbacteria bacterium]|jgi:hypothetical protein|nr:hypothetical protein [Candidatus Magasanikbacteria bacterium]
MTSWKVGRDAINGEFITVEKARRRKKTATVETMRRRSASRSKKVASKPKRK